ncbi:lipid A export permease/ATP-binding protein MsbA [Mesosutterella sp. OilRF-GAM-744-9]|uniref:Lipid A export permease/ATP-binding protein MsbA n=2 Tax=Mesosutterella TaxID=2494213 RepID=A0ABS9MRX4_9BURK|nr:MULTISPECIES: lipid A export permease/ATP-binding protein MsbA [unclassified Mesosutterella]MCG5031355.1 lipid A export permease/ATP-binding protein MsbA [Mesosutterella sp. oilRF-744-WT-GAM-9]MDL2059475.1 lipid A export permease/ATP-binding protein MsbA [Mesosutterella sp. AGMB02718]
MNFILNKIDPVLIRLFRYLIPYKKQLALSVIFLIGSASTSSLTATLLGKLTDLGFYQQEKWVIVAAPIALLIVSFLYAFCTVMSSYVMTDISESVLVGLRTNLFSNILNWPSVEYQNHSTGLVSSKFVNEASIALGGATESLIILIRDSLQVLSLLCVLFWYNWQLTLVTFIVGPGLVFILRKISKRMRKIVKESQSTLAIMIGRVQESYSSEKLVKISNTYDVEENKFKFINEGIKKCAIKTIKMQSIGTPLTQILTMIAVAFVVAVALTEAHNGLLSIGDFITFLSAMLLMKAPIQHLAGLNATFASISVAAKSIFEMLDTKTESDDGTINLNNCKGEFSFEHVFLRYPGQTDYALNDINLKVSSGEHVALVGLSGSGKSSFVNLLPRYWDVSSGEIFLDGRNIKEYTLKSLRSQIAIVSQDVILFDDTIRNNITYGCNSVSTDTLNKAIDGASLRDFINSLPQGLDTPVGEAGHLLSGGQKQRISIARALLKDAPILILDEATSALDSENEYTIKNALKLLTKGKTTFTVAHRLSTIDDADKIVVLSNGRISQIGTNEELLQNKDGIYWQLCHFQGRI